MEILQGAKGRHALWAFVFVFLAIIWLRTGTYPAASTGDEVFFAESGYWFSHDGVLKRPWMADAFGGGAHDFFPPILPLITAGLFWLLGPSSFSIMASSSLAVTCLLAGMFIWLRARSVRFELSLVAPLAFFGLVPAFDVAIRPRYEPWVAVFIVFTCAAMAWSERMPQRRDRSACAALAGAFLALACVTYYPAAPFVAAAGIVGIVSSFARDRARIVCFAAGGAVIGVAWGTYFFSHFQQFHAQLLAANRADTYFSLGNILKWASLSIHDPKRTISTLEICAVFVFVLISLKRARGDVRVAAVQLLILAIPLFVYAKIRNAIIFMPFAVYMLTLLAERQLQGRKDGGYLAWMRDPKDHPYAPPALCFLAAIALLQVASLGTAAWLERPARHYARFESNLLGMVDTRKTFGVDQRAWLALREKVSATNLHLMDGCHSPQTVSLESSALMASDAPDHFDYLLILPGALDRDDLACYPALNAALRRGDYALLGVATPYGNSPESGSPAGRQAAEAAPLSVQVWRRKSAALDAGGIALMPSATTPALQPASAAGKPAAAPARH